MQVQRAGRVDYRAAWEWQRLLHAGRVAGSTDDTVLLLEHPPVYTAGRRTQPGERPPAELASSAPVIEVDRGGKITFHGPGQLVGYPVVALPDHVFVVDYVRRVEEVIIAACADLGVHTGRVRGRTGVWLAADPADSANSARPERKIAALGVRVSRGVTMHGFAVNADVDLSWFDRIVPCGIADADVTSLSAELNRRVRVDEVADAVEPHLRRLLSWQPYDRSPDLERSVDLERGPALAGSA